MASTWASGLLQTDKRSQPACAASTAASAGRQPSATAFISRSSETTTPSYFSSSRSSASRTRGESVAGQLLVQLRQEDVCAS